uniref:CCHC-type domain-containing protein n=1 Tax=Nicotiana tabacum TaxID=4097 RepID=A0A1S4D2K1_TOBAC
KAADDCFLYAFVALCTSISGWQHCRPVVVVDGTFLKSAYRGIILTTSTMDAAGTIFPLAYVVVDSENDASWKWSLSNSRRHMVKELQSRSYTLDEFNERMLKIEEVDPRVKSYLYDIGYHRWTRVHATVRASTDHLHTVLDGVKRYIVCLETKKSLRHRKETYENYCSPYYTRKSLLLTYEMPVNPLPDESKWDVPQHILDKVVKPPTGDKRQPERPHKERYKTFDEIKSKKYKVSCENCGGEGHNKRTCKNAPKKK